ncbi:MAG: hypothetical protein AB7V46_18480 [Thermomicrobiales bacterium]
MSVIAAEGCGEREWVAVTWKPGVTAFQIRFAGSIGELLADFHHAMAGCIPG